MCACNGPSKTHDLVMFPFPSVSGGVNKPYVQYDWWVRGGGGGFGNVLWVRS